MAKEATKVYVAQVQVEPVSGPNRHKVFNPGDEIQLTDEQAAILLKKGAVKAK